jgi:hypothetical protein
MFPMIKKIPKTKNVPMIKKILITINVPMVF